MFPLLSIPVNSKKESILMEIIFTFLGCLSLRHTSSIFMERFQKSLLKSVGGICGMDGLSPKNFGVGQRKLHG